MTLTSRYDERLLRSHYLTKQILGPLNGNSLTHAVYEAVADVEAAVATEHRSKGEVQEPLTAKAKTTTEGAIVRYTATKSWFYAEICDATHIGTE